jgi:hypothetical protein
MLRLSAGLGAQVRGRLGGVVQFEREHVPGEAGTPGERQAMGPRAGPDARPDRHALLELQALFAQIGVLRSEGDADRFTADARYRWVLHRLWIAAGNEALAYTHAAGQPVRADRIRANLYDLRNHLARSRLPDIDEGLVRRFTRARLDSLQATIQHHLRTRP